MRQDTHLEDAPYSLIFVQIFVSKRKSSGDSDFVFFKIKPKQTQIFDKTRLSILGNQLKERAICRTSVSEHDNLETL